MKWRGAAGLAIATAAIVGIAAVGMKLSQPSATKNEPAAGNKNAPAADKKIAPTTKVAGSSGKKAPPATKVAGSFGSWTLLCSKDGEDKKAEEHCSLVLRLVEKKSQKQLFRVVFVYGPKWNLVMRLDAPTGVALPRGIEFSPNTKKQYRIPFRTCLPNGCDALFVVEAGLRQELANSKQGSIAVYAMNGKAIRTAIPFDGFSAGMKALEKKRPAGRIDRAIADNTKLIELNPKLANPELSKAYSHRAAAYGLKGDFDRAIADYTKSVEVDPKMTNPILAKTYGFRGAAYAQKGDLDHAIADYTKSIKLDPNDVRAYVDRGAFYLSKGDYDRALADHTKVIAMDPKLATPYNKRAIAYYLKGDYDRAIADHTKAIAINPNYAEAYTRRGTAFEAKAQDKRAIADHNKAIAINPTYTQAYFFRCRVRLFSDLERALADCTKAISLSPNDPRAYNLRALVYENMGQRKKAEIDRAKEKELKAQR